MEAILIKTTLITSLYKPKWK